MLPSVNIGSVSMYHMAYLVGILLGWIMFVASEEAIYDCERHCINLKTVFLASLGYGVVVLVCIQGANYFHYVFDTIPEAVKRKFTWQDIVFTDLLRTVKVLYGAIFFYPIGIWIASRAFARKPFWDYLNRKGFILFFILGFARIGCFLNGCCYGICSTQFGIRFPMGSAASAEHLRRGLTYGFVPPPSLPVIPTQIVSAGVLFLLSFFSWRSYRQKRDSQIFIDYVLYYAVFRLLIEFLRDDVDRAIWWGISASQWISFFIITGYFSCRIAVRRSKAGAV